MLESEGGMMTEMTTKVHLRSKHNWKMIMTMN
jgi:hypothetical protein